MNAVARALDANSVPLSSVGGLAVADVATILFLVVLGELRHGVDVLGNPGRVLATAGPFLVGWLVVATLVGAYDDRAFEGGPRTVQLAVGTWLGGAGIGLTLRGTRYFAGDSPLSFALVMAGLGAVALATVRLVFVTQLDAKT